MPFINPFSKQKKKSRNLKIIPTIIADIHEKNSLVISELKSSKQINLDIKHLKIGDYLIGKTIIERKTTSDFICLTNTVCCVCFFLFRKTTDLLKHCF